MFQFLFGYPVAAYAQGKLSLLSGWPRVLLVSLAIAGVAALGWRLYRRGMLGKRQTSLVLILQTAMLLVLLVMLWRPALVVTTAAPRQNIAAVLIDDSASMNLEEPTRLARVKKAFGPQSPIVKRLGERFQVRMYRFSDVAARVASADALTGSGKGTRLEDAIDNVLTDLDGLPLGAIVLVTDGADNAPASLQERGVLAKLKSMGVPLHTVGAGKTSFDRDLQVNDVSVAPRALAGGVVAATVSVKQEGFAGQSVNLEVFESGKLIQSVPVKFDRPEQTMNVRVNFTPRSKGVKEYTFAFPAHLDDIQQNNAQSRVILVDDHQKKILYLEGEPRWDYKFIRRAVREDHSLEVHGLLRTSANKFLRQGMDSEKTLEQGFPKQEELFAYDGLILGSVEAGFFSAEDTQNIFDFVSRRGGGLLMIGGRLSLSDGGYQNTLLADLVPVHLAQSAGPTFLRQEVKAALTPYGLDHPMLQLGPDAAKTAARWKLLPQLGDYTRTGEAKPGAVVLATVTPPGQNGTIPLLTTQRFGRGHTVLFASASSWRWKMEMDHKDDSHERIWRQILRGLVEETPGNVMVSTDRPLYRDDRRVVLRVEVRDKKYAPVDDAAVTATVTAPNGTPQNVRLDWSSRDEGVYTGVYEASAVGDFTVDTSALRGKDDLGHASSFFERTEGTLEYFDAQQNRALLTRLSSETGGRYYALDDAASLPDDIVYTQGGITEKSVHELWKLPIVFFLLMVLKGTEWGLRKMWGSV
jgi:uncharacterized membrane protein